MTAVKPMPLTPKLRFPEFRGSGPAKVEKLRYLLDSEASSLAQNKLNFVEEGYPVYGADGLVGHIEEYDQSEDYIAIVKDGAGVGRLFLYEKNSSILGTLTYLKAHKRNGQDLAWLFYLLQTLDFSKYVVGSGIPHIYFRDYSNEIVPVPSILEQQKIADCLGSLDDLIAAEDRKLEALRQHKQGLMQQLFPQPGKTTPRLRFPEFRNAGEWRPYKFGDFVLKSFYGTSASTSEAGQYPVLRMGNMIDGGLDFSNLTYIELDSEELESFRLKAGDILLNRTNSRDLVGKVSIFDSAGEFITASYIVSFRLDEKRINPWFCNLMLNTQVLQARIKQLATPSISQANINPSIFKASLDVIVPKLAEQERIADCLGTLDDLIAARGRKLEALRQHKKGLMQRLFPDLS